MRKNTKSSAAILSQLVDELSIVKKELADQKKENEKLIAELATAKEEKRERADELIIAKGEKQERANELIVAKEEKQERADELIIAKGEKQERADELIIAKGEKQERADELIIAKGEKQERADELIIANKEKEKLIHDYRYTRHLLETSLDPLVTIDANGKITDVNSATENATGLSRDTLIGTDFSDYFTEPDKARIGYQKVFAEGTVIDYPLTIRNKSNKLIDVLYNASVYHSDKGEVLGVFAADET